MLNEKGGLPVKIRDSVVFVTGANRGIGLEFAQELLAAGALKVYAAARNPERIPLDEVTRIRLNVTNPNAVASAAIECPDLINNAGIARATRPGLALRLSMEVKNKSLLHVLSSTRPGKKRRPHVWHSMNEQS